MLLTAALTAFGLCGPHLSADSFKIDNYHYYLSLSIIISYDFRSNIHFSQQSLAVAGTVYPYCTTTYSTTPASLSHITAGRGGGVRKDKEKYLVVLILRIHKVVQLTHSC